MRRTAIVSLALVAISSVLMAAEVNWPQFRGGLAAGVASDKPLPETWSTTKNVQWKIDIPGRGWSSPIVWGDKIFITSVINEGKSEDPKKGLYFNGERKRPNDTHRYMVYCIDWNTGKMIWEREAHKGVPPTGCHVKNTYASETPVTDGQRVFAYFGNLGLYCYDLDGKLLWTRKVFPPVRVTGDWGTASSPALHGDRLYIVNDNEQKSYLVALDTKTGEDVWRIEREEKSNWATPFIWENGKRTEIITAGSKKIRSYDLEGRLLWELGGNSSITVCTPFTRHGLLYVGSGYVMSGKRPVFAVKPGATGDITLKDDEKSSKDIAWCQKLAAPYNTTPLVYGDYMYVVYDMGTLACFNAKTGKEMYPKERLGGAGFTSSPWAADGKIYCLNEDGDTFVIKAGPEFKILAKNSLDEMCMASPATARGSMLIRTLTKLYKIGEAPK